MWQEKLEIPIIPFTIVEELNEIVHYRKLLWKSKIDWKTLTDQYKVQLFKDIDDKAISKKCDEYFKYCGQLERTLDWNEIQVELKQAVENYKGAMPVVLALKNEHLMTNHWEEIAEIVGIPGFNPIHEEGYTLEKLIEENVV